MRRNLFVLCSLCLISCLALSQDEIKQTVSFDFDWRFALGDYPQAAQSSFDDTSWRLIQVPHDWSIEGAYSETGNLTDWQSGYLPGGMGWYRKSFDYRNDWDSKEIRILFDGVYMNSSVWINGHFLGKRPYGYSSFEYNLTPYLKKGRNVIAVQVDNTKPLSGRWYTGAGIYRHVWLKVDHPLYIPTWGVHFHTVSATAQRAEAQVKTLVISKKKEAAIVIVRTLLKDRNGSVAASSETAFTIEAGTEKEITQNLYLYNCPQLWSPDTPNLYTLESNLFENEQQLFCSSQMPVGIRQVTYSANGLLLNGKPIKLKGVCDHHTAGALGAAVPDQALERRLKILKEMGCNAIRTAHNPFSPVFYTICDSLGLIVLNEAFDGWEKPKARDDYGNYFAQWWERDLTDFVVRDRNHPCVLLWSIGNEVNGTTPKTQKKLVDVIHALAPQSIVTQGGSDPTRGIKADYKMKNNYLDVVGFNGNGEEVGEFEKYRKLMPDKSAVATEVPHTYQTRGVYRSITQWRRRDFPAPWEKTVGTLNWNVFKKKLFLIDDLSDKEVFPEEASHPYYQSSYDNALVRISARKAWQRIESFPWIFGQFRWGSFDYLGEANWPQRCGNFGIIDICGFPKDNYYLYQSLWSDKPMVHILPHWTLTGKEGMKIPVVVYTNCKSVELFLNNHSFGKQPYTGEQLVWHVPYKAGELKAVGVTADNHTVTKIVRTAGKASRIALKTDRSSVKANRTDVVHVEIDITDAKGNFCPLASNEIIFDITGPARLLGVDNGDPVDLSSYQVPIRKAFRGKALLILQTTQETGTITVKARAQGLETGIINVVSL